MSEKEVYTEFTASLPPIGSAINISGNQNGARIKLDISESDMVAIYKLAALSGKAFKVKVFVE